MHMQEGSGRTCSAGISPLSVQVQLQLMPGAVHAQAMHMLPGLFALCLCASAEAACEKKCLQFV